MGLSKRDKGDSVGALKGSRILDVYTGNKKPNLNIRCTFLKVLASAAGKMVLLLLQTARVAEASSTALRVSARAPQGCREGSS